MTDTIEPDRPVKNAELAWKVRDLTVAHPEHHDQAAWYDGPLFPSWATGGTTEENRAQPHTAAELLASPGSTACFAVWALLVAGYSINARGDVFEPDGTRAKDWIHPGAQRLLGLADDEARELFHNTSARQVPVRVEAIFGPRPEAAS